MTHSIRTAAAAATLACALAIPTFAQDGDMAMDMAEPIVAGDLVITQPWTRATPPAAVTGAGYLTITNNGDTDDRLLGFESDVAAVTEVHEMIMADDRMMMRPLEDGLVIPAGETVVLRPGGFHIMFIDLAAGIEEGASVHVTLVFAVAGEVTIDLEVYPIGSDGPAMDGGAMDGMDMDGMNMDGMGEEGGA